jgi:probable HAF family extracellular repeat protein
MNVYERLFIILLFCVSVTLFGCNGSTGDSIPKAWKIVDLGVLPGNSSSIAYDINENGIVVGSCNVNDPILYEGFLWETGTMAPVGYGGYIARSVNDSGEVAGEYFSLGSDHGFIRLTDGSISFVEYPQNWTTTHLYSINNKGHAAGSGSVSDIGYRGFLFDRTNIIPIEPFVGDIETMAVAVNDSDVVVGYSFTDHSGSKSRGFIFKNGEMIEIGFLPGEQSCYPEAINNNDIVVGNSGNEAFMYSSGVMTGIGFLPGDSYSCAFGINDRGDIVGRSGERAYFYRNGQMVDLSSLDAVIQDGWDYLFEALSINDKCQIVGYGYREGSHHAFLLTPVP